MRNTLLVILLLLSTTAIRAQDGDTVKAQHWSKDIGMIRHGSTPMPTIKFKIQAESNHSVSIYTIGAAYGYEQRLGGFYSIVGRAGLIAPMVGWSSHDGFHVSLNPTVGIEPRYYYNYSRRLVKYLVYSPQPTL